MLHTDGGDLLESLLSAFYDAQSIRGKVLPAGASLAVQAEEAHTDVVATVDGYQRFAYRVSHLVPVRSYLDPQKYIPEAELSERLERAATALSFWLMDEPTALRRFAAR